MTALPPWPIYPTIAILLWWTQPWVLQWALSSRSRLVGAGLLLAVSSAVLAVAWHRSLRDYHQVPRFVLALLWYPIGTQILRYMHAAAVGPAIFCQTLGLSSPWRVKAFMWSAPTLVFVPKHRDNDNEKNKIMKRFLLNLHVDESWMSVLQSSLFDLGLTILVCAAVLHFEWYQTLPGVIVTLLRILIMGTSVSLFRVILEVPVRFALRQWYGTDVVVVILPIYNQPLYSTSPRDFWRRWSTSVGFHLRCAWYDPCMCKQSNNVIQRWLATALPFGFNCVWHVTWWSWAMKGEMDGAYVTLLGYYPMVSLALQDLVVQYGPKHKWLQAMLLRGIVWIGFACVAETMQVANGAPPSLRDTCRSNLLLPRLPPE